MSMTKQEYADYEAAVKVFFEKEGINCLSSDADSDEAYFSWRHCDCCCRPLGGMRHDAKGYNPTTKEIYEYSVCTDCVYYAEYGQLDDMTMMDLAD